MREVMTRMRLNIEAPAETDAMAGGGRNGYDGGGRDGHDGNSGDRNECDDGGETRNDGGRKGEREKLEGRRLVETWGGWGGWVGGGQTIGVLERPEMEPAVSYGEPS